MIVALIIAAGVPSATCAALIRYYMSRMERREAARAEEAALSYQANQAALGGVRECAKAIVTGKHNGDLDRAAAYADDIKHKQADFMARKAAAK